VAGERHACKQDRNRTHPRFGEQNQLAAIDDVSDRACRKRQKKKGRADAVCVSATIIGPALSETINQAAPTLCMNVPTSETMSATIRLRNVGFFSGRQRLAD